MKIFDSEGKEWRRRRLVHTIQVNIQYRHGSNANDSYSSIIHNDKYHFKHHTGISTLPSLTMYTIPIHINNNNPESLFHLTVRFNKLFQSHGIPGAFHLLSLRLLLLHVSLLCIPSLRLLLI